MQGLKFKKQLSRWKEFESLRCGHLLADFGAEVIKIEPLGKADPMRRWGPKYKERSLWCPLLSCNKKCITLN
jgi:crotonobetainyl-CoA:carnitine CoA-transferase CaiB-like acyl-CoA transferase